MIYHRDVCRTGVFGIGAAAVVAILIALLYLLIRKPRNLKKAVSLKTKKRPPKTENKLNSNI